MAYSLFNSGAAAAYANSFRQRNPYGGFDEIKSDLGKETFGKIPFLNFKAELDMAKAGLKEVGATHRQHITNEASKEITEMKYGDKGGGGSNAKKAALARMLAGGSGSVAKRSGGVTSNTLLQMLGNRRDPLADAVTDTRLNSALDADDVARRKPFDAMLNEALQNGPSAPSLDGGQLQVTPPQTPQVKVDPLESLDSDKAQGIIEQVLVDMSVKTPPTPETPGGEK